MGLIQASVGSGGTNNMSDVKVVQWLLNKAEYGYHFMNDLAQEDVNSPGIKESGVVTPATQIAIENWASFCDRVSVAKDKPPVMRGIILEPDN